MARTSIDRPHKTKTETVVQIARQTIISIGRTAVDCVGIPVAAATDSGVTFVGSDRIDGVHIICAIHVVAPLVYVAMQVIQSPPVGCLARDCLRRAARISAVPPHLVEILVDGIAVGLGNLTVRESRRSAASGAVFPLGFRR